MSVRGPLGDMVAVSGLLFVCTGNLCRSPIAEGLTRAALQQRFGAGPHVLEIASAGTRGVDGQQIWPLAAAELARRGIRSNGFRARSLDPPLVLGRDLILTATLRHRTDVVMAFPETLGRVFSWREFAWLLSDVGVDDVPGTTPSLRLRELSGIATRRRDGAGQRSADLLDVADPMGGGAERFRQAADEIADAVTVLVDLL